MRASAETLIIARTDAIAVEVSTAPWRAPSCFVEAGAHLLFLETPRQRDELSRIGERFGKSVPLIANMVEGGNARRSCLRANSRRSASLSSFSLPAWCAPLAKTAEDFYGSLRAHGSSEPFRARMFDFDGLNRVIGTPETLARGTTLRRRAPRPQQDRTQATLGHR